MTDDAQSERVDWLCGCGNGRLQIPIEEIPDNCPLCGQEFPIPQYSEEDI